MNTEIKAINTVEPTPEGSTPKKKKRLKFKMPSAVAILFAVVIFAVMITWVVHFATTGNYADGGEFAVQYWTYDPTLSGAAAYTATGYYEGGMNWFISEYEKAYPELDGFLGVVDGTWVMGPSIETATPMIDGNWFNFNHSNWYVSGDGMYGIGNSAMATVAGAFSAFDLIFFTIAIGVMIELLMETEVLKGVVSGLIRGLGGKEIMLLPTLFIVFSLWGTVLGTQEATLAMMPIVVPALIVAGFDAATGFLVILVGVTTGISASILEPFALGTLAAEFNNVTGEAANIGIGTGIVLRFVLWVVYTAIGCAFVTWYGKRTLKGKSVEEASMQEANKVWAETTYSSLEKEPMTGAQKFSLGILGAVMITMVIALLPWTNWMPGLEEAAWFNTLSHMFFFSTLIGHWSFIQLGLLFVVGWFIAAKSFGYNGAQMRNNWKNSWNTFYGVALILTLSRATSIILTNSGSAYFLANNLFIAVTAGIGSAGLLSLIVFLVYVPMACLIPSMSGLAGISAPIISPIVASFGAPMAGGAIIGIMALYPLAQGVVNMTMPTTGLVVAQAEASNTSYGRVAPYLFGFGAIIMITGVIIVEIALAAGVGSNLIDASAWVGGM